VNFWGPGLGGYKHSLGSSLPAHLLLGTLIPGPRSYIESLHHVALAVFTRANDRRLPFLAATRTASGPSIAANLGPLFPAGRLLMSSDDTLGLYRTAANGPSIPTASPFCKQ